MEYYSAIKGNEIMIFVTTWMDLEIIIVMKSEKRQILYDIIYLGNLKYGTSELIYKSATDAQRTDLWLLREGVEEGWSGNLQLADINYYM